MSFPVPRRRAVAAQLWVGALASAAACLCMLGLGAGVASAGLTHHFEFSFDGSGAPSGVFVRPLGDAIDQASGDIYVVDASKNLVDKYTSAGVYAGVEITGASTPQTSFSVPEAVAVDNSGGVNTGDVYVADRNHGVVDRFDPTGAYLGQITLPGGGTPSGLAVDSNGNLYVSDDNNFLIDEFSPSGSLITQITSSSANTPYSDAITSPQQLAVDPSGNVYVVSENHVLEFSGGTFVAALDDNGLPKGGLAVDPGRNNDLYTVDLGGATRGTYIAEFDLSGNPVVQFGSGTLGSDGVSGLAVLGSSGEVYAADTNANNNAGRVDVFSAPITIPDVTTGQASAIQPDQATLNGTVNPNGVTLNATSDGCQFEYVDAADYNPSASDPYSAGQTTACASTPSGSSPVPVSAVTSGLSPDTTYHFRLEASNTASGGDAVYGSDQTFTSTGPPTVTGAAGLNPSSNSVLFQVRINPHGFDTTYHIDYGTSTAYGSSTPATDIGSANGDQTASARVSGLLPSTTYHFQVLASNSQGNATGPDLTFTTGPASCPNDAYRTGGSAGLPDCRAYEQVTPANKDSVQLPVLPATQFGFQPSDGGNAMAFTTLQPLPGSPSVGLYYVATRGASGWTSKEQIPPQSTEHGQLCEQAPVIMAYSPDLSSHVLADGGGQTPYSTGSSLGSDQCGTDSPNLVGGEPQGVQNLFLQDPLGAYQLVSSNPLSGNPNDAHFGGASDDLSHVLFAEDDVQLTPDASASSWDVYDYSGGTVHLITTLPDASQPCGGQGREVGVQAALYPQRHEISADGSRIFYIDASCNLYTRLNDGPAVQVDASQGSGPGGGGQFQTATPDGSQVFFTDASSAGLTTDTGAGSGDNLYRYDTTSGTLTDLTPGANAHVLGVAGTGVSQNGAYLYFVAQDVLASGASAGQPNLYVWHAGATRLVATLDGSDGINGTGSCEWSLNHGLCSRSIGSTPPNISPDGSYITFDSDLSLTGQPTNGYLETYLYNAQSGQLTCVSCSPVGAPATAPAFTLGNQESTILEAVSQGSNYEVSDNQFTLPRSLAIAPDGTPRVFFTSVQALLPQATDGKQNVYEYEAGSLRLISSGASGTDDFLLGASANGNDVFFATSQQLAPTDLDGAYDVYDARVDGGFATPVPPALCVAEACRSRPTAAPPPPTVGTVTFTGPGNVKSSGSHRPQILSRAVRGAVFFVRVRVPASGRITVTGHGIGRVSRWVRHAGTVRLRATLTKAMRRVLRRRHLIRLALRVGYTRPGQRPAVAAVRLIVRQSSMSHTRRARAAGVGRGGAR